MPPRPPPPPGPWQGQGQGAGADGGGLRGWMRLPGCRWSSSSSSCSSSLLSQQMQAQQQGPQGQHMQGQQQGSQGQQMQGQQQGPQGQQQQQQQHLASQLLSSQLRQQGQAGLGPAGRGGAMSLRSPSPRQSPQTQREQLLLSQQHQQQQASGVPAPTWEQHTEPPGLGAALAACRAWGMPWVHPQLLPLLLRRRRQARAQGAKSPPQPAPNGLSAPGQPRNLSPRPLAHPTPPQCPGPSSPSSGQGQGHRAGAGRGQGQGQGQVASRGTGASLLARALGRGGSLGTEADERAQKVSWLHPPLLPVGSSLPGVKRWGLGAGPHGVGGSWTWGGALARSRSCTCCSSSRRRRGSGNTSLGPACSSSRGRWARDWLGAWGQG